MNDEYLIVIEEADGNFSAYLPDLPGCVATGLTRLDVRERMSVAIRMHLDGLIEDGCPIPQPRATSETITPAAG